MKNCQTSLASCLPTLKHQCGFTLVELVTILVMIGILAAVAIPRMDTSVFYAAAFHDRAVAALRYAQKTATSHRRVVCVAFTSSTVTLTIDHDKSGACDGQALNLPGGSSNIVQSGDTTNAIFSAPVPATLYFQPDGRGTSNFAGTTIYSDSPTISGQTTITIAGATGYVQ